MSRTSVDHPHPRPFYAGKSFRRCRNNMDKENTNFIDVDSDYFDNVITIDVPDSESFPKKYKGPSMLRKDKQQSFTNVINIDDDDEDDETPDSKHSGFGANKSSFCAEASSSKNLSGAATDEHQFVQENVTPVRLSKCKRTYSGKASTSNHYGFDTDLETESDASDSDDFPDCDLMVDSSGKVQEQWEKAFLRRRKEMNKDDFRSGDNGSTSQGVNGNQDQHTKKGLFSSSAKNSKSSNGNKAPCSCMDVDTDFDVSGFSQDPDIDMCPGSDSPFVNTKLDEQQDCEPESSRRNMEVGQENKASPNSIHREQYKAEEVFFTSPAFKATMRKCQNPSESGVDPVSSFQKEDNIKNFQEGTTSSGNKKNNSKPSQPCATGSAKEKENLAPSFNFSKAAGQQTNSSSYPSSGAPGSFAGISHSSSNLFGSKSGNGKGYCQENRPWISEILLNESELRQDDSVQSSEKEGEKDDCCQSEDDLHSVESCMISEREKLKETDEYKRAMEEEWASRQQTLQIQAEEAQHLKRLRRRKTAENLRLSDMKKRQKQRLEEIRTSQKKDEENMYLKEVIRAEIRKDLQKLELSCHNMASLLHCLGVRMNGWPNPPPQEVQAAYKKALLTFHPDRASRSDIRQQVEAEEKFKLVNRVKDKFSPSL